MGNIDQDVQVALEQGNGVLRLAPNWVPREFCIPGKRLKLHPDDYYAFGAHRGGIDERWFASTTKADNGPETRYDEGLSYIHHENGNILLRDAIDSAGAAILGRDVMERHGGWTMFSKFFDNLDALPHHMHQSDETAAAVGQKGKPEAYYFPKQLNNTPGHFAYTFFGLNPGTTKDDVKRCLERWDTGDNGILYLSKAYKLQLGTGWNVPPGVLHAPGSLLTYEPQRASDVGAIFQSLAGERYMPWKLLVKDVPEEFQQDLDYLVDMLDWEANLDPDFSRKHFLSPRPIEALEDMRSEGYEEYDISYHSEYFSAKELTILPGRTAMLRDASAYGAIVIQGHGKFGMFDVEAPDLIRFGQMTQDEVFVSYDAAREGIRITNQSARENLVLLKHFGPEV